MIFGKIELYVFRKSFLSMFSITLVLISILWIIQALKHLDIITTKGQTLLTYFYIASLGVPALIMATLPIALLLAIVYTLNSLNSTYELIIINASGASPVLLIRPFLLLAFISSLFISIIAHYLGPVSLQQVQLLGTKMRADLVSLIVQEGDFSNIQNGITFHVAKREAGGILKGIMVYDMRDENISVLYTAQQGKVESKDNTAFLIMNNGEIYRNNHLENTYSTVSYSSYIFDLSDFSGKAAKNTKRNVRPKEMTSAYLIWPDPDDTYYKQYPQKLYAQLNIRIVQAFYPLVFVLVILVFSIHPRSTRQHYTGTMGVAAGLAITIRGVGLATENSVYSNDGVIIVIYLIPIITILLCSFFLITNRHIKVPYVFATVGIFLKNIFSK